MKYNGHRSWNAWNVSLWINNDEGLYNLARGCYRDAVHRMGNNHHARRSAARQLWGLLPERTPDGANYNLTCIYEALEGILD